MTYQSSLAQTVDTSRQAYRRWLETELLPNEQPPSFSEWVELALAKETKRQDGLLRFATQTA